MQNVLTAIFNVESEGFQAFKEIQDGFEAEQYFIPQMALVKKHLGYLMTLDSYESPEVTDGNTFSGGLLGSLIGVLGGPIGMLLGGVTGATIGATTDDVKSSAATSLLDAVTEKLSDKTVAIVALVDEDCEEPLDNVLSKFDAVVLRRDVAFVAQEVAEAKRLEMEVQNQVREKWKAEKKQQLEAKGQELSEKAKEFQASVQAKIDQAKADFEAFKASLKKKV